MGFFDKLFKKQPAPQPEPDILQKIAPERYEKLPPNAHNHRIAGVKYYKENLMKIAKENPDYSLTPKQIIKIGRGDENIYQYKFAPIRTELIPEPSNPQDPNAVKVVVDGQHVGYIKAGSCSRILKLIRENRIEKIDCKVKGGKCKWVSVWSDEGDYETGSRTDDFRIEITIYEK